MKVFWRTLLTMAVVIFVVCIVLALEHASPAEIYNAPALAAIFIGTLVTTLISFPLADIKGAAKAVFTREKLSDETMARVIKVFNAAYNYAYG